MYQLSVHIIFFKYFGDLQMTYPFLHPEEWLILPEEERLLTNRTPHGRLGFAVLLKFFQIKGRFPDHKGEVGKILLLTLPNRLKCP